MGYEAIVEVLVESGDETAVIFADATNLYPGQAVDLAIPGSEESSNCWGTLALPFEPTTEPGTSVTSTPSRSRWTRLQVGRVRAMDPMVHRMAMLSAAEGCAGWRSPDRQARRVGCWWALGS